MASNVLLLGVLYLQESSLISQHVHQQGQSSAKDVQLAGFLTFSTTTEAAKLVLSTNNGLVSTRGARRALLPHLIAHSGAGFAFSQKEDFRRSMSSWLARAADLLARVAMNRLRLAFCSRASELAILGAVVSTCSRSIAEECIWYPFSPSASADKTSGRRASQLSRLAQDAALLRF